MVNYAAMSPTQNQSVNAYPLTGEESSSTVLSNALRILKPHLPTSLPTYRRLQFGRFFEATRLLSNLPLDSLDSLERASDPNSAWFVAFVDRSCRPETEVWFYGNWEDASSAELSSQHQQTVGDLLRNLVLELKNSRLPTSIHQDVLDAQANADDTEDRDHGGFSRKDYAGHAADSNIMLWGATHERTVSILQGLGVLSSRFKTTLMPNFSFMWDVDALPAPKALPEGLRWGELKREHFALVRSRTQIPRQDRTMAVLPNLAIFPTGRDDVKPIAWVFVGLDSSLTTLHVEVEYRGRGLAKAITTKLFKEKMGGFWEEGVRKWGLGYVIVGNKESEGMCRSLGGKSDWEAFWLRLDLGMV